MKIRFDNAKITVEGLNLDRLLNTLNFYKINITFCKFIGENKIQFYTKNSNVKKIDALFHNSTYKIDYKLNNKCSRHTILLFGIFSLVVLFFSLVYSNCIFNISILGVNSDIKSEISEILKKNDIKQFSLKYTIDNQNLENILLKNCSKLSQVDVSFYGSSLIVNAKEKLKNVEFQKDYKPLYSDYNGTITSIEVISGTSSLKIGDKIRKGQILIEPYAYNSNGEKLLCVASGKFVVDAYFEMSEIYDEQGEHYEKTGAKIIKNDIKIFNLKLNSKSNNIYSFFEQDCHEYCLTNFGFLVKIKTTTYYELAKVKNTLSFQEIKENMMNSLINEMVKMYDCSKDDLLISVQQLSKTQFSVQLTLKQQKTIFS